MQTTTAVEAYAAPIVTGDRVSEIQIWTCKQSWFALSEEERAALLKRLTHVLRLQSGAAGDRDMGPFLIDREDACLLVFGKARRETTELASIQVELSRHFALLATVGPRSLFTPRALADRLRNKNKGH
jgi:hypothetical protein